MESTTDDKNETRSERLEQDTEKEIESGDQSQANVKETENKNPGEAVREVASVGEHRDSPCPMVVEDGTPASQSDSVALETGTEDTNPGKDVEEVASAGELHVSPCPMVVEEGTAFDSQSDSVTLETGTKDDESKMDTETTHVDKNTQLVNSVCLNPSPSAALDTDKGLVSPTMEALVEQTDVSLSSLVSSNISKDGVDSAKVGGDTARDKTAAKPDSKLTEVDVKEPVEPDAKMVLEVSKASEKPNSKFSGDHVNDPVIPDTKTVKENDHMIDETDTVNSEAVPNHENELSKPEMETSTNSEKGPDLPVTDTLTDTEKGPDVLVAGPSEFSEKGLSSVPASLTSDHDKEIATQEAEPRKDLKDEVPDSEAFADASADSIIYEDVNVEPATDTEKKDNSGAPQGKDSDNEDASMKHDNSEPIIPCLASSDVKSEEGRQRALNNGVHKIDAAPPTSDGTMNLRHSSLLDDMSEGNESGSEEEQSVFMKELENFFRERSMEFKPPKFYGEGLNCLKLWRAVTRLGGYDKVTACKLWRQVGESFRPPKTCTTVSWTFRGFYEKALLEYERHKVNGGELQIPLASNSEPMNMDNQAPGSGRARRDAAARAMQGWHSQRVLGNDEDKSSVPQQKKQIGTPGLFKRKRPVSTEHGAKSPRTQVSKPLLDVTVVDVGPPADWVKVNVQRTKDCFEVYALVPGLLREEVRVQSDPAGRLVISGEPENPDNLWGATPFKKVVSLPARIDPHHTSAVVTLNGQLFVRAPLEQSD
ncbi:PREDICTED: AT-rich interactive domain-containing protein 3-like [Tarenaya hassleriana]|uniref:AT-rich interactive domain-containing protein 3-like n=1 Tax=Tarenaya hassleriana TaxID=28532 RepID=UPI00053C09E4|nr:PREDICTED: AT-rich interactive domain-containing protein 3-like [Tarenaya hassleriana]XP_010526860.1 PREDICTED: AT-rich interactive domain-containing protein 3-like [Tarenaya hassleriana]